MATTANLEPPSLIRQFSAPFSPSLIRTCQHNSDYFQRSSGPNGPQHAAQPAWLSTENHQAHFRGSIYVPMQRMMQDRPQSCEEGWRGMLIRQLTGVSKNYRGNPYLAGNQSADIPEDKNTAVWVTNLPPTCDHAMLLANVRNCGKVYATVINSPNGQNPHTAACKLVFFDVAGAQNLLRQSREGRFAVGGYIPRIVPNRIRSEAQPLSTNSRVLHIEGPSAIVNEPFLTRFFADKFTWETETVRVLSVQGEKTRLEWRFGSYRCQAGSARTAIMREDNKYPEGSSEKLAWQSVAVYFAVDPCAPAKHEPSTDYAPATTAGSTPPPISTTLPPLTSTMIRAPPPSHIPERAPGYIPGPFVRPAPQLDIDVVPEHTNERPTCLRTPPYSSPATTTYAGSTIQPPPKSTIWSSPKSRPDQHRSWIPMYRPQFGGSLNPTL
ncbi:hypothetical protein F5Y15DRAFT_412219 [Xylariaceae sp. FL0016]|nr:hypothetical protein F5Y15DRAFT_412219 [Xylariaceae sp. FL0016]